MKPIPMSYSRANTSEECLHKFKKVVLEKVPEFRTPPLMVGALAHELADQYAKHLKATGQKSDHQEFERLLGGLWERRERTDWAGLPEGAEADVREVAAGLREVLVVDPERLVASEVRVAIDEKWRPVDWMAPEVWWRGVIDRVDVSPEGKLKVIDYKTGYRVDSDPMQQLVYSPMARAYVPESQELVDVEVLYVRLGLAVRAEVDAAQAERARRWMEGVSRRVQTAAEKDEWPATPGPGCATCPVFEKCPARHQAAPLRAPQDADEARVAASRLVLLEVERERLRESLKGWVQLNGPVEANGMRAGFGVKRYRSYDTAKLLELLRGAKVLEPLQLLKADTTKLERVLRKDKALEGQVRAIEQVKAFSEFGLKKVTEEEGEDA